MRNPAIRLAAVLSTFAVGVALVTLRPAYDERGPAPPATNRARQASPPPPAADPAADESLRPIVAYCELVGHPERYDGQLVRVRASLRMSIHGLFLSDAACDGQENMAAVELPAKRMEGLLNSIYEATGWRYVGAAPVEVITTGRFERVTPSGESDSLLDTAPLRFRLMLVEKAVGTRREGAPGPRGRAN